MLQILCAPSLVCWKVGGISEQTKSKRAGKTGAKCTFSYQPTAALHFPAKLLIPKTLLLPPSLFSLQKKPNNFMHSQESWIYEDCFWPLRRNCQISNKSHLLFEKLVTKAALISDFFVWKFLVTFKEQNICKIFYLHGIPFLNEKRSSHFERPQCLTFCSSRHECVSVN